MQISLRSFFIAFIGCIILGGGVLFVIQYQQSQTREPEISLSPVPDYPVVVARSAASEPQVTNVLSPDGSKKIQMKVESKPDNEKFYSFAIFDKEGNNEQQIFTRIVSETSELFLPENSWSPDNKYVFIQEKTKGAITTLVFKASGESFANDQQYLDATTLFTQRQTGYTFDTATGWADPTLLIIRTKKDDGTKGPSYWFVIPTKAFLQLAR